MRSKSVEPIFISRRDWPRFLKVLDEYEGEDIDSPMIYLLHRALGSKKRARGGYMLYPMTEAEREAILDVFL